MNFLDAALREMPVLLCSMDDATGVPLSPRFVDYSGYNRSVTTTSEPSKNLALCSGTQHSHVLSNTNTALFESPVYKKNRESDSFSLEAWFMPISTDGTYSEQQVLSSQDGRDGLTVNGSVVSFSTKYTSGQEARVSFNLQSVQQVHAVGVHTKDKNSLYINGELVAELSLSEVVQADTFLSTGGTLESGETSGTQKIALGPVALYAKALSAPAIYNNYRMGALVLPSFQGVAASMSGDNLSPALHSETTFMNQQWSSEMDWQGGQLFNVSVENNELIPQYLDGLSLAGAWLDSFAIDSSGLTSIYGVSIDWSGENVVVEASVDGTTWVTASRGVNLSNIAPGYNPTDKELQIRVSFASGLQEGAAYLDSLTVTGVSSAVIPSQEGRTLTLNKVSQKKVAQPWTLSDSSGAEIHASGSIVISSDSSGEAKPVRTLELVIKKTTATNPTFSVSGTAYNNGVSGSTTLARGEWVLLHIVTGSNVTGNITISNPALIASISVYEKALTAAEVATVAYSYSRANILNVVENNPLSVVDSANPIKIYSHDWSIQPAG